MEKNNDSKTFDSMIMLRYGKTKVAKKEFYGAKKKKKKKKNWDVDVDNCKYLIGYLDEVLRPLVLILPKMSAYIKTFKEENNKLISLGIDDDKLLERYKTIWT